MREILQEIIASLNGFLEKSMDSVETNVSHMEINAFEGKQSTCVQEKRTTMICARESEFIFSELISSNQES